MIYRRSGLAILAVSFLALLAGIAKMLGGRENDSPLFKVLGAGIVLGVGIMLFLTVQRWAGYFFAVCVIAAVKAVFALVFGVTVSVPHLVTDRPLVLEVLGLLAALSFLTFRFVTAMPRSTLQAVSLVLALIGLAWAMLTEPNYWPLCMSVGVLGIEWVTGGFLKKPRSAKLESNG